jgi:hypothetical protein
MPWQGASIFVGFARLVINGIGQAIRDVKGETSNHQIWLAGLFQNPAGHVLLQYPKR